jgi:hypothetical protein
MATGCDLELDRRARFDVETNRIELVGLHRHDWRALGLGRSGEADTGGGTSTQQSDELSSSMVIL